MTWESDSELSNLYRRGAREEPPAWLDRAIEAAAQDEAASRMPAAGRPAAQRWQAAFALAAVLVLAVSVHWWDAPPDAELMIPPAARTPARLPEQLAIQSPDGFASPTEHGRSEDRPGAREEPNRRSAQRPQWPEGNAASEWGPATRDRAVEPLAPKQAAVQTTSPSAAADQPTQRPRSDPWSPWARDDSSAAPPPAAPAPAFPRVPSAKARAEEAKAKEDPLVGQASAERRVPVEAGDTATRSAATAVEAARPQSEDASEPAAARADAGRAGSRKTEAQSSAHIPAQAAPPRSRAEPEPWLKEIEELFRQGRVTEAQEQLAAFRQRFPDHELPPRLRER